MIKKTIKRKKQEKRDLKFLIKELDKVQISVGKKFDSVKFIHSNR
jgi:hypothetical protein